MMERARQILKSVFGFDRFISLQEEVIQCVLERRDCLAVMPTGGGKSLCFQIPALLFPGLTVVVSPLIALMKDQVDALTQLDVPAVLLNSTLAPETYRQNVDRIRSGGAKLLYVAPETLLRPQVLALLDAVPVSCLAIDEAHCISEWGHDFRPEYRQLAAVRSRIPDAVCLALTATATPQVRKDIRGTLGFDASGEFLASFDRENLLIRVVYKDNPMRQAMEILRRYSNDSGIVYCATRSRVDALCAALAARGFSVCPYHAGLPDVERHRNQERFVRDDVPVMVATVAFGMGIDKSNIRFVVHYDLPKNLESYYQEIGRAGRDGLPAECLLLFSPADIHRVKSLIAHKQGMEQRAAGLQLSRMIQFAESEVCRRIPLLAYFGETYPLEDCGRCDNCLAGERELRDLTIPAQKFLSCVKRTGERFGIQHIVDVLRGSKAEKVLRFRHDELSTYGIGRDLSSRQWRQVARQLLHRELIIQEPDIGCLSLTQKAWEVLRGKKTFFGRLDADAEPAAKALEPAGGDAIAYDRELFDRLRQKRRELAEAAGVPPYVIFSDRSLIEMAAYLPRTPEVLLRIHGVGQAKLDRYGPVFIGVIDEYCRDHPVVKPMPQPRDRDRDRRGPARRMRELAVLEAFNAGQTVESLARELDIRENRVLDYLLHVVQDGRPIREESVLAALSRSEIDREQVMNAFDAHGWEMLRPVFDALDGEVACSDLALLRLLYLSRLLPTEGAAEQGGGVRSRPCRLICLANSRKYSGRCIAGKEVAGGLVGGWVRPVSGKGTGELTPEQITLRTGVLPQLLDILTLSLLGPGPHAYQSENRVITGGRWVRSGRWEAERISELVDDVAELWINGYHSPNGLNDRMPVKSVEEAVSSSLLFIRAGGIAFTVQRDARGLHRVRARFTFRGDEYRLPVTDPEIEARYLSLDVGEYPAPHPEAYVTVSIGEPYEGFCYKLASAFLPPEEDASSF